MTFKQLTELNQLDSTNNNIFKYLQIKPVINRRMNVTNNTLRPPQLLENMKKFKDHKRLISKLSRLINTDDKVYAPVDQWNKDLKPTLTEEHWTDISKHTFYMTPNTNLQLIQFKIIHRTHIKVKCTKWDFVTQTLGHNAPWESLTLTCTMGTHSGPTLVENSHTGTIGHTELQSPPHSIPVLTGPLQHSDKIQSYAIDISNYRQEDHFTKLEIQTSN